jgi:HAMP domain-containing protein
VQVEQALAAIRHAGLHLEAQVLAIEIPTLKNEIKDLRNAISTTR